MALVIINPEVSSNTDIDNFNIRLSKLLSAELTNNNISNYLVRNTNNKLSDTDRDKLINNNLDSNSLIITNGLGSEDIEIIYGLNKSDSLASRLANNLTDNSYNVNKYYQRRNSYDTSKNYDSILNSFKNNDNVIIRYGSIQDISNLNINDLANVIASTLKSFLGLSNDIYIVKSGDNLYSIANKYNVSVDKLKSYNNLTSNTLSIGQKIYIPSTTPPTETIGNYYIVKSGDNLYSIARMYNITVDKLKEYNNLTSNVLSIGQKIKIPSMTDSNNYYIVKEGDNLYSIARKYNTSVDTLKKLNNLNTNILSIGKKLILPSTNDNYITYKVAKGDTLYSLANKYNTTVKDIMNINNLSKTSLSINQVLKIPR